MAERPAVLFDVDGTLVDSTYLHTLAWWRALDDAGRRVPMAAIHRLIGMGSTNLLTRLLGEADPLLSDGHTRHYQRLKGELTPLPGASELLAAVAERGATVVLATSAKPHDVEDLLRVISAGGAIDVVVHSGDVTEAKPDGEIFRVALDRAGCGPARALAVGDSVWDVEAAAAVGLATVALATGGNGPLELLQAGARAVYEDPADLLEHLDQSPLGTLLGG